MRVYFDQDGVLTIWKSTGGAEHLFEEGFFGNLLPNICVLDAVEELLRRGIPTHCLSKYEPRSRYALREKTDWLERHLPSLPAEKMLFCPGNLSKADYLLLHTGEERLSKSDILIDDFTPNLQDWEQHGGTGLKLMNGFNGTKGTWRGVRVTDSNSEVIVDTILKMGEEGGRGK